MALVSKEGQLLETNPSFQQFLGYEHEELRGMGIREFTFPDDTHTSINHFQELLKGRIRLEE